MKYCIKYKNYDSITFLVEDKQHYIIMVKCDVEIYDSKYDCDVFDTIEEANTYTRRRHHDMLGSITNIIGKGKCFGNHHILNCICNGFTCLAFVCVDS